MPQNMNTAQITLRKFSDPYCLYKAALTSQGLLGNVTINIVDRLSDIQLFGLQYALNDKQGPLSHFTAITYNIKDAQSKRLLSIITKTIPRTASFLDVYITDRLGYIKVHFAAERVDGVMTQKTSMAINEDFDRRAPELNEPSLINTSVLELRSPQDPRTFPARLGTLIENMQTILTNIIPYVKIVVLSLDSPLYTQKILQTLGRLGQLKKLELVFTEGFICSTQEIFDFQCAIMRGLRNFRNAPELIVPGALFSRDLFLGLGDLKGLRSLTVKGTASPWLPESRPLKYSGKFLALKSLNIDCHLDLIQELRYLIDPVPTLTTLILDVPQLQSPMEYDRVWSLLAKFFPGIEVLHFLVRNLHQAETRDWLDMRSITAFPCIEELVVQHPRQLEVSDDMIAHYIHSWPLLSKLSLNPRPQYLSWNTRDGMPSLCPTWDVIRHTIRRNGVLKDVSLYLGTSRACRTVSIERSVRFDTNRILEKLTIGSDVPLKTRSLNIVKGIFGRAKVGNVYPTRPSSS